MSVLYFIRIYSPICAEMTKSFVVESFDRMCQAFEIAAGVGFSFELVAVSTEGE